MESHRLRSCWSRSLTSIKSSPLYLDAVMSSLSSNLKTFLTWSGIRLTFPTPGHNSSGSLRVFPQPDTFRSETLLPRPLAGQHFIARVISICL
mmetsp:Transcript_26247/g.83381  ORF Transcript_26247/g.83381 Transcript_26247/m.83381 type:complete len:93 (-) Transcript_26247:108-386(-)